VVFFIKPKTYQPPSYLIYDISDGDQPNTDPLFAQTQIHVYVFSEIRTIVQVIEYSCFAIHPVSSHNSASSKLSLCNVMETGYYCNERCICGDGDWFSGWRQGKLCLNGAGQLQFIKSLLTP
jgi:hypothetical protein